MIIEPKHFEYLVIQRGEVAHERKNFNQWQAAYEASLQAIYENVAPFLPRSRRGMRVLDIGSGLGGFDILLDRHYSGELERIYLLDGADDPPEVKQSFKTFSNARVSADFLAKNGVGNFTHTTSIPTSIAPLALVVSFAAYGFHIHPGDYLDDLKAVVDKDTVIILEVRRSKKEWLRLFVDAFGVPDVLHQGEKFVRLGFHV